MIHGCGLLQVSEELIGVGLVSVPRKARSGVLSLANENLGVGVCVWVQTKWFSDG